MSNKHHERRYISDHRGLRTVRCSMASTPRLTSVYLPKKGFENEDNQTKTNNDTYCCESPRSNIDPNAA